MPWRKIRVKLCKEFKQCRTKKGCAVERVENCDVIRGRTKERCVVVCLIYSLLYKFFAIFLRRF